MKKRFYFFPSKLQLAFAVLVMVFSSNLLFADGSKDLYPNGKTGTRAYLRSSSTVNQSWPFANNGTHYVYAQAGERITMASSAQNGGNAKIELYNPNGVQITLTNPTTSGQISTRAEELAGPQLFGGVVPGRYTPIYYQVPSGGDGIYRVQFYSRSSTDPNTTVAANANWSQGTNAGIMAWDVSVISNNIINPTFISGRVYTNILNFSNGTSTPDTTQFNGIVYALTKDGYIYRVNNNGNNGLNFTFMVNNNGFIDANTGDPIYNSINSTTNLGNQVHDPNSPDTGKQITHKMFYTLPASDLPASANGGVNTGSGSTWLKNTVISPTVANLQVEGVEGTSGQMGSKGGYIKFNASTQGNYKITIESNANPAAFASRILTGSAVAGNNNVLWDGKDGLGNSIPSADNIPVKVTIQLQGAEVHFPFMDMEYNKSGIIIELLDNTNLNNVLSDIVYWNDTGIPLATSPNSGTEAFRRRSDPLNNSHLPPINSAGISSNTNGHIWGQGATGTSGQFGDNKSIDTWTFIKGQEETLNTFISVKTADLKISSITKDKMKVSAGETVIYTIKVKNDGPNDVTAATTGGAPFSFILPLGFEGATVTPIFTGNTCGSESTAITYNTSNNTYNSVINLPNGCEITYVITIKAVTVTAGTTPSFIATILRPKDVTDPDATDPNVTSSPTDPFSECTNNGLGGNCNNILNDTIAIETYCVKPGAAGTPDGYAKFGVLTKGIITNSTGNVKWPENVPNGHIVMDSENKGFVITHMTTTQRNTLIAVEGMIIYNTDEKCVQLYRGTAPGIDTSRTGWNCIERGCNE